MRARGKSSPKCHLVLPCTLNSRCNYALCVFVNAPSEGMRGNAMQILEIVYYQCVYPAGCTKVQNAWIDTHTPTGINICWQSVIEHAQMVLLARLLPVNCSTIFLKKMMLNFRKFSKNSGWHGTIVMCI